MTDVRAIVRRFILEECRPGGSPADLTDDELIIDNGTVDSMTLVRLTSHLEQETGVVIEAYDVNNDNFGSVNRIVSFVGRLSGSP